MSLVAGLGRRGIPASGRPLDSVRGSLRGWCGAIVHLELGLGKAFHRVTYAVRMGLMKGLGPADLPESVDPQQDMRREHEIQEAAEARADLTFVFLASPAGCQLRLGDRARSHRREGRVLSRRAGATGSGSAQSVAEQL